MRGLRQPNKLVHLSAVQVECCPTSKSNFNRIACRTVGSDTVWKGRLSLCQIYLRHTYLLDNLIILPKCLVARGTKISGRVTISGTHQHSLHPKSQGVHKPSSIYESACSVVVRTALRRQQRLNLPRRRRRRRRRSFRYRESATRSRGKNSALAVRPSDRVRPPLRGYFLEISPPQTQHNVHPLSTTRCS